MTVMLEATAGPYTTGYTPEYLGTPSDIGGLHLRVWDITGTRLLSVIPELQHATVQDERNQPGQLALSVPMSGLGVARLAKLPAAILGLYEQGRQIGKFVYDEDTTDDADRAGPDAELGVTAPGALKLLDWAAVYPEAGFGAPLFADFVQMSPGAILRTVLTRAQARGTLDGVSGPLVQTSFSDQADSDGTPWPSTVWVRYDAGKSMLDVVNDLAGRGYIDVRMRGFVLDAYVANGSPDVSRSPIDATVTNDAQGWQAVSGCTVARDTGVIPLEAPGVTASVRLTGAVPALAGLQAAVDAAQATLTAAQATLDADTATVTAAAAAANRSPTPAEQAELDADTRAVADAQKAYADAVSVLQGAELQVPTTDAEADTVATFPVVGGTSYDAGLWVHSDAVTRVVSFSLAWRDAGGNPLGSSVVGSTTDSPSGWGQVSGQVTAPIEAHTAVAHYRVVGLTQGELHYAARPVLSPTRGTTVNADLPTVVLHRPAYVQSSPRRRQRSPIRTALLGMGEANLSLEAADRDAIALYGRREGPASQGGVADYPTLQRLTQLALDQAKRPQLGWTVNYSRSTGDSQVAVPQPWRDYLVGNSVRCDWIRWTDVDPLATSTALVPIRVSSITASYDASGVASATVELADVFMDEDVKLQRQITGLLMGASSADPLGATPVEVDLVGPVPVTAVFVGSSVLLKPDGTYEGLASITWPEVISNTDGTPFDDLGWYEVDYRVGTYPDTSAGWQTGRQTQALQAGIGGLAPAVTFQARVLPVDFNGNYPTLPDGSPAYTYSVPAPINNDTVGPTTPSAPVVTPVPGGLSIDWNGLDNAGAGMPPDYANVRVHVSTVTGFTPTAGTLMDTIAGPPASASTVLATPLLQYGVDYYVRLVAYDTAGNPSPAGVQAGPYRIRLIGPADLDPAVLTNTDHSGMFVADTGFAAGGSVVADAAARDGFARQLTNGQTANGVAYAGLKPGRYRATWVIRTNAVAASPAANLADVDVTGANVVSDGARTATTADASSATGYRTVAVRFTVTAGGGTIDLPIANAYATGTVWLSHAYIEPVQSVALAEIRDAMVADLSATKLTAGLLTADVIAAADANGKPGRIRVGIINPGTGLPTDAGFSVGSDGIKAQAAGGAQTLLIDTAGNVTVSGSITAGSDLPGSVYSGNLVANASMEDLPLGGTVNVAGTVPAQWVDGFETAGTQGSAYADAALAIGGTRSLSIACGDTASGRGVASKAFAVVPGERLQVTAQLKQTAVANPVYVRVLFGTAPTFTRAQTVAATVATPDGCVMLNLDGSVRSTLTGSGGAGIADVMSAVLPPLGVTVKATGSVVVPAGATWARLAFYSWSRGGATPGNSITTFDNSDVRRSADGHTINSAVITGPTIRTAAGNVTRVEVTGNATAVSYVGPQVNFFQTSATAPPAQLYTIDFTTVAGVNTPIPNVRLFVPQWGTYTTDAYLIAMPNNLGLHIYDHATQNAVASLDLYDTSFAQMQVSNVAGTAWCQVQMGTTSFVVFGAAGGALLDVEDSATNPYAQIGGVNVGGINGARGIAYPGGSAGVRLSNGSEVDIMNNVLSSFVPCKASSFPLSSSADLKFDIAELDRDYALDAVRFAPARTWRYDQQHADDPQLHVFPVLEDLPSEVWHDDESVELRDVVGLLWQAVRELAEGSERRFDELAARVGRVTSRR